MKPQTTRISAYGIITHAIDNQERILLCRLAPMVEQYKGQWTLPGGGINWGEVPKTAVVREVKEETGLTATVGDLLDVDSRLIEFSDKCVHAIRIIYRASVEAVGPIIVEQGGSTDAVAWFSRAEVREIPLVSLAVKGVALWGGVWDV